VDGRVGLAVAGLTDDDKPVGVRTESPPPNALPALVLSLPTEPCPAIPAAGSSVRSTTFGGGALLGVELWWQLAELGLTLQVLLVEILLLVLVVLLCIF